mmetsp:Transcript_3362/g.9624  ORF Transcript_3362/g.9624 Transcript_3362/m.9624 type:complete len:115 (+) Transcript_3362:243-587(+)
MAGERGHCSRREEGCAPVSSLFLHGMTSAACLPVRAAVLRREVIMVMTVVKAVRDLDRDKNGQVSEERCSEGFWLSIVLFPLLVLSILLCFCWCPASFCNVFCGCFKRMKYHPV